MQVVDKIKPHKPNRLEIFSFVQLIKMWCVEACAGAKFVNIYCWVGAKYGQSQI